MSLMTQNMEKAVFSVAKIGGILLQGNVHPAGYFKVSDFSKQRTAANGHTAIRMHYLLAL